MVEIIKKIIKRMYPELSDGYHLPQFGIIVGIPDQPSNGAVADEYRPRYAVDILLLKENGKVNQNTPRYNSVPLPMTTPAEIPEPGTWVEVAFAYGSPDRPFIRTILSHNKTIPPLHQREQKWQRWPHVQQTVDAGNNWQRITDAAIKDCARYYQLNATYADSKIGQQSQTVEADSTKTIGGNKVLDIMEALKVTVGEKAFIAALQQMTLATNDKLETYSKANTEMTTDAALRQVVGSTVWIGTQGSNIIRILLDIIKEVSALSDTIKTHTHNSQTVGAPDQASDIGTHKDNADALSDELDPITEQ